MFSTVAPPSDAPICRNVAEATSYGMGLVEHAEGWEAAANEAAPMTAATYRAHAARFRRRAALYFGEAARLALAPIEENASATVAQLNAEAAPC